MANLEQIRDALLYIDGHLYEPITLRDLAARAYFSPYYFHRLFTAVAGRPLFAYIRDRRLAFAALRISGTEDTILSIALDCGFSSAQAFSRTFRSAYGLSPREYRRRACVSAPAPVDEIIKHFTNRLRGGMDMNPRIIKKKSLRIAGVSGDGNRTGEVWNAFLTLDREQPAGDKVSESGYELRFYDGGACTVHVGAEVRAVAGQPYQTVVLPASVYAAFDVYVADGYDSENRAINEWLASNGQGWRERLFDGRHTCVEYYDERFQGEEAGSIVELWIPIERDAPEKAPQAGMA